MEPVISGRPILDSSGQSATTFAIGLYLIVGLVIFGFALREKFRWVNRFDPRLWRRELKRIQRLARKPYTEEELEDQWIDRGAASDPTNPRTIDGAGVGEVGGRVAIEEHEVRTQAGSDATTIIQPELPRSQ